MLFASVSCEFTSRVPHVINKFMGRLSSCVLQVLIPDEVAPICSRSKTLGGVGRGKGGVTPIKSDGQSISAIKIFSRSGGGLTPIKSLLLKVFLYPSIYEYILYMRVYTISTLDTVYTVFTRRETALNSYRS